MRLEKTFADGSARLLVQPDDLKMLTLALEGLQTDMSNLAKWEYAAAVETAAQLLSGAYHRGLKKRARWLAQQAAAGTRPE